MRSKAEIEFQVAIQTGNSREPPSFDGSDSATTSNRTPLVVADNLVIAVIDTSPSDQPRRQSTR